MNLDTNMRPTPPHAMKSSTTREVLALPPPRAIPSMITPNDQDDSSKPRSLSKSIPISCKMMHPSESELQLQESERVAEHRDFCMYARIVNGISNRKRSSSLNHNDSWRSDDSLASIIKTRHTPIQHEGEHYLEELDDNKQTRRRRVYPYSLSKEPSFLHESEMNLDDCREDLMEEGIFDLEL